MLRVPRALGDSADTENGALTRAAGIVRETSNDLRATGPRRAAPFAGKSSVCCTGGFPRQSEGLRAARARLREGILVDRVVSFPVSLRTLSLSSRRAVSRGSLPHGSTLLPPPRLSFVPLGYCRRDASSPRRRKRRASAPASLFATAPERSNIESYRSAPSNATLSSDTPLHFVRRVPQKFRRAFCHP